MRAFPSSGAWFPASEMGVSVVTLLVRGFNQVSNHTLVLVCAGFGMWCGLNKNRDTSVLRPSGIYPLTAGRRRLKMTAWIQGRTGWIIDRNHPEKTRARILAIILAFVPLIMAAVLALR